MSSNTSADAQQPESSEGRDTSNTDEIVAAVPPTDDPSGERQDAAPATEKATPATAGEEVDAAGEDVGAAGEDVGAAVEEVGAAGESQAAEEGPDDLLSSAADGIDPGDESARIEVLQADSSTPYHSAKTFEELGLSAELMRGIHQMKFAKPSKIQATSLPMIISPSGEHKNLIAQAHNGSGKTACFVLGMLSRIDFSVDSTQALCLVPTRELARQIEDVIRTLGRFTGARVKLAVKATDEEIASFRTESASSAVTEHIVVGTPGKVVDLFKKRRINTKGIKILVLDEADEMVDTQGMGDQTLRIKRQLVSSVQVLLFSATYRDEVRKLAGKLAPEANVITVKREALSLDKVQQFFIDTGSKEERFTILSDIYACLALGQSIIFVRTRATASSLTQELRQEGHTVSVLYGGDMRPDERDRVIDEFRNGTTRVLVTTNVLSRGVDILSVNTVINYDLPTDRSGMIVDPETYLHRIGRTGRFGRKGVAVNFVYDERTKGQLKDLEEHYSKKILEVEDVEALSDCLRAL